MLATSPVSGMEVNKSENVPALTELRSCVGDRQNGGGGGEAVYK